MDIACTLQTGLGKLLQTSYLDGETFPDGIFDFVEESQWVDYYCILLHHRGKTLMIETMRNVLRKRIANTETS